MLKVIKDYSIEEHFERKSIQKKGLEVSLKLNWKDFFWENVRLDQSHKIQPAQQ